jgi:hypothetical protein
MKKVIFLLGISIVGCTSQQSTEQTNVHTEVVESPSKTDTTKYNEKLGLDYGMNYPAEKIAKLILQDSFPPKDNNATFKCLDSIKSYSNKSNTLYFKALTKIAEKSDGALSEVMGKKIMDYIKINHCYFFTELGKLNSKQKERYAFLVGYELSFLNDRGTKWFADLITYQRNCADLKNDACLKFIKSALKYAGLVDN